MASTLRSVYSGSISSGSTTSPSTTITASSIMAAIQEAVRTEVRAAVSRALPLLLFISFCCFLRYFIYIFKQFCLLNQLQSEVFAQQQTCRIYLCVILHHVNIPNFVIILRMHLQPFVLLCCI